MTAINDFVESVVGELRAFTSVSQRGQRLVFESGRFYSDGDAVEVFVLPCDDDARWILSDGGVTLNRSNFYGVDESSSKIRKLWSAIVDSFGVQYANDRIYTIVDRGGLVDGVSLIADASVAADSVRLLHEQERQTFTKQVESWLSQNLDIDIEPDRKVVGNSASAHVLTATVNASRGRTAVQAVSGTSTSRLKRSIEHAFFVLSDLRESDFSIQNRVAILESVPQHGTDQLQGAVSRLTEFGYVIPFSAKTELTRYFGTGYSPEMRDLAFHLPGQRFLDL